MAYGDSGFFPLPPGAPPNTPSLAFTEGKISGKDGTGKPIVRDKKFVIDTGASKSSIDRANLKGMNLEYKGALVSQTAAGPAAQDVFSGVAFQFQATDATGKKVDLECNEPFLLLNVPLLGADQFKSTGATITLNYKESTVKITGEKK